MYGLGIVGITLAGDFFVAGLLVLMPGLKISEAAALALLFWCATWPVPRPQRKRTRRPLTPAPNFIRTFRCALIAVS